MTSSRPASNAKIDILHPHSELLEDRVLSLEEKLERFEALINARELVIRKLVTENQELQFQLVLLKQKLED